MPRDLKMYNCKQLAEQLGVNQAYITAMRRNGFVMPGNKATTEMAQAWLKKTPAFRITKPRANAANRSAVTSGKQNEPHRKHAPHTA